MAPLRQRMTLFFLYSICSANIVKLIHHQIEIYISIFSKNYQTSKRMVNQN